MPLVVRSVTAFSIITTRNGTAMIPDSIIEIDGYLEDVRRIQPASIRQLSPCEGAHGTSSVASARLIILQQVWIRRRRSDVEKQLAYAVINTTSKQHRDVRREKETRNNSILQWNKKWCGCLGYKLVRTYNNVRHRDGLSRSFSTCWTLLNTMWITFDPNWQQGKPHRRQLFFLH